MKISRAWTAVLAGAAVIGASAVAASFTPASASTSSANAAGLPQCSPVQPAQRKLIGANGKAVSFSAAKSVQAAAATKLTYKMPDGTTVSTITPPASFKPQTAAPATARAFGFDAPDNPTALKAWRAKYQNYKSVIPSAPCVGKKPISHKFLAYSSNWGGYVATGGPYNSVHDSQNIPTFGPFNCGGPNGASITAAWIGIGGYTSGKLIQQGFSSGGVTGTSAAGVGLWYEYLNDTNLNPPVYIGPDSRTGDTIVMNMTYSAGTTVFHWYDSTIGVSWTPVTVSGLDDYYDGTSAEWISERPQQWDLRKFGRQTFFGAGASYLSAAGNSVAANMFNFTNTEVRLTTTGSPSAPQMIKDTKETPSAFYQDWQRCS